MEKSELVAVNASMMPEEQILPLFFLPTAQGLRSMIRLSVLSRELS